MKIYSTYCSNYEKVITFLDRHKSDAKLANFVRKCEKNAGFNGLDLPSLLIMPG